MDKYYPDGDRKNNLTVYGYVASELLVAVLKQCGDDLTRANVMKQAADLHDLQLGMVLPRILVNTSPTDFRPLKQLQMERFDGRVWRLFGPVRSDEGT